MNKGVKISWRLIFITMCIMLFFSVLGNLSYFKGHSYLFVAMGEVLILIPVYLGFRHLSRKYDTYEILGGGFSPVLIPILFLLPFSAQSFVTLVTMPFHMVLYEFIGYPEQDIAAAKSMAEFITQVIVICLIPAVTEELLCRGIVMKLLKPYGVAISVTMSALAFSMLHFSIHSFIVIFTLGLMLGMVKLLTGSIYAAIFMHFSNNFLALIMTTLGSQNVWTMIISGISVFLYPILIFAFLRSTRINAIEIEREKKRVEFSYEMIASFSIFILVSMITIL